MKGTPLNGGGAAKLAVLAVPMPAATAAAALCFSMFLRVMSNPVAGFRFVSSLMQTSLVGFFVSVGPVVTGDISKLGTPALHVCRERRIFASVKKGRHAGGNGYTCKGNLTRRCTDDVNAGTTRWSRYNRALIVVLAK